MTNTLSQVLLLTLLIGYVQLVATTPEVDQWIAAPRGLEISVSHSVPFPIGFTLTMNIGEMSLFCQPSVLLSKQMFREPFYSSPPFLFEIRRLQVGHDIAALTAARTIGHLLKVLAAQSPKNGFAVNQTVPK
ncbi:hypothetical protein B0F90DRAFT_65151 [Multifurca ochricompacta]|uniref:Uncharacterized protein n=1 Tax=Multifurca ochricompacta TaxID=376703 RepID=A0AAD4MDC4_9AGAM|nr:hypothetical protein B0F90DRAFT_65151 [Multifurca ochricompacta]